MQLKITDSRQKGASPLKNFFRVEFFENKKFETFILKTAMTSIASMVSLASISAISTISLITVIFPIFVSGCQKNPGSQECDSEEQWHEPSGECLSISQFKSCEDLEDWTPCMVEELNIKGFCSLGACIPKENPWGDCWPLMDCLTTGLYYEETSEYAGFSFVYRTKIPLFAKASVFIGKLLVYEEQITLTPEDFSIHFYLPYSETLQIRFDGEYESQVNISVNFSKQTCLDDASCESTCGNGIVEGFEWCDGSNLDGITCEDLGKEHGTLRCKEDCSTFDAGECGI